MWWGHGARSVLRFAMLALVILLPTAAAAETLVGLEAPHSGTEKIWDVTVLASEARKPYALIYRNLPSQPFGIVVYDAEGAEVFAKNGTRGIQTLPPLEPGPYRFFVRGTGAFQVTDRAFERNNLSNVTTTLGGTADAYVHSPTKHYDVAFTGDVDVEWWDLTGAPETFRAPASRTASVGKAYVTTVSGAEGAAYTITLTPIGAPAVASETPFVGVGLLVAVVIALSMARRT